MPIFTPDTSCIVAAVCTWHEHHGAAVTEVNRRLEMGERMAVPAPALVEAYAVLTRLPAPHRLSPVDAWTLVETGFIKLANVQALTAGAYKRLLRHVATAGIAGGRTYDLVIAECARKARAETLLTLNPRHFDPAPEGVAVVDPTRSGISQKIARSPNRQNRQIRDFSRSRDPRAAPRT